MEWTKAVTGCLQGSLSMAAEPASSPAGGGMYAIIFNSDPIFNSLVCMHARSSVDILLLMIN
jgi:hypothetical protein